MMKIMIFIDFWQFLAIFSTFVLKMPFLAVFDDFAVVRRVESKYVTFYCFFIQKHVILKILWLFNRPKMLINQILSL